MPFTAICPCAFSFGGCVARRLRKESGTLAPSSVRELAPERTETFCCTLSLRSVCVVHREANRVVEGHRSAAARVGVEAEREACDRRRLRNGRPQHAPLVTYDRARRGRAGVEEHPAVSESLPREAGRERRYGGGRRGDRGRRGSARRSRSGLLQCWWSSRGCRRRRGSARRRGRASSDTGRGRGCGARSGCRVPRSEGAPWWWNQTRRY